MRRRGFRKCFLSRLHSIEFPTAGESFDAEATLRVVEKNGQKRNLPGVKI